MSLFLGKDVIRSILEEIGPANPQPNPTPEPPRPPPSPERVVIGTINIYYAPPPRRRQAVAK